MEYPNNDTRENEAQAQRNEQAVAESPAEEQGQNNAPLTRGEAASDYLLTFTKNATEDERVILEQFAGRKRHPRVTDIGKPHSALEGVVFLMLCPVIVLFGLLVIPGALPLLMAGVILLLLMGTMRIANAKKRPCICPYCAHFDNIKNDAAEYQCPRCKSESVRVGDELRPKIY